METNDTLSHQCYLNLKEAIIRGDFAPGEKLKIANLKSVLKVGPTPIREALARLTITGLIDEEPHKGFRVKPISESQVSDIYRTFNQIETLALCQAIELGDEAWEAQIVAALHKLSIIENSKDKEIDRILWLQRNNEFHLSLISGCGSPCLLKIREELYQLFERYCYLSLLADEASLKINYHEHSEIAKAVLARDKSKACRMMSAHLEKSYQFVVQKLKGSKKA